MKRFADLVIRLRVPILAASLLISLAMGWFLKDLGVNADILSYLPEDDPVVRLNNTISERFGGTQLAVVALEAAPGEARGVFTPATLAAVARLTRSLQEVKGVSTVTSLTTAPYIRAAADWIEVGRLVDADRLPSTAAELEAVRQDALADEEFRGRLVSTDGRATVLLCRLQENADKAAVAGRIREAVRRAGPRERVYYAGLPFQLGEISRLVIGDIRLLVPLAGALIFLVLLACFRSLRGALLPLLAAGLSTLWTLGCMSLLGVSFSVISNVIPVVLLATGSAYGIHVVSAFREEGACGAREGPALALRRVALPVLMAALTTAAGFLSFILGSYLTMIREFGILCALGVSFALLLSLTLVPAILSFLPPERRRRAPSTASPPPPAAPAPPPGEGRLAAWLTGRPLPILAAGGAVVLACLAALPWIHREVDLNAYFRPGTDIRRAEELMQARFGGSSTIQILASGDLKDPAVLAQVERLQDYLAGQPRLHHVSSILNLIRKMNGMVTGEARIPDTREQVANLWFLLEGEPALAQMVDGRAQEGVIQATLERQNSREVGRLVRGIETWIREHPSAAVTFRLGGSASIHHAVDQALRRSLAQSLVIALGLIWLCNLLLLRSAGGALVGLAPILFTLAVLFGVMGLTGIPLDVATVLLGGISLGIGVDYSIHMLHRCRAELRRDPDRLRALRRTLATTGWAVAVNVLTVSVGFLPLLFGSLVPLRRFAVLILVTMAGSGLAAVTLLPALLLALPARLAGAAAGGAAPPAAEAQAPGRRRRPGSRRRGVLPDFNPTQGDSP